MQVPLRVLIECLKMIVIFFVVLFDNFEGVIWHLNDIRTIEALTILKVLDKFNGVLLISGKSVLLKDDYRGIFLALH